MFKAFILVLIASLQVLAQSGGSLGGTVTDPNGAIVPGATVTARNEQMGTEVAVTTSRSGVYVMPNLAAGLYSVVVEHTGFKKQTHTEVNIAVAERATLDVALTVGDVTQSVEVIDRPPLLATETSESGTNFQPKFMQDGPLFVSGSIRNPQNFISFMPGVNNGFQEGSVTGSSRRSMEILIDGASNVQTESGGVSDFNQFGSVEQFGEFRLLTNTFSAEYGRTGGGIQIFTTRSGTNAVHGSAFNFLRNDFFDAAGWGVNRNRTFPEGDTRNPKKPKVRQNEWGFNVGGPVFIPKLYDGRNKSFFYFTYNGFDQAAGGASGTATLPSALMRQGNFSELPFPIYDPRTTNAAGERIAFPGNVIPRDRWSSVSAKILGFIPDPSAGGLVGNYSTRTRVDTERRVWSLKGDHFFSDRNRINAFLSLTKNTTTNQGPLPGVLTAGNESLQRPETYRLNHDYTFAPTLLNHFTFGFTRFQNFVELPPELRGQNLPAMLGLKGVETGTSASFPNVTFGNGFTALGTLQNRSGTYHWTTHINDAVSWVKGRHEFKFGGEWRRMRTLQDPPNDASVQGIFNFANFQTSGNNTNLRATTGHSFASFLLGEVDSSNRVFNAPAAGVDVYYGHRGLFVNDNFKVNSKLTLNLGLRWDSGIPREDHNEVQASFNPNGINAAAGGLKGTLIFVGEEGTNRIGRKRFGDIFLTDFGPRLGFAYQVTPKTVVRGGYGIFYSPSNGLIGGGCFPCTFGVSATPAYQSNGFTSSFNWEGGFPLPNGFQLPPVFAPDAFNNQSITLLTAEDGRQARINNWTFNIQRELPGRFLFDIGYIGSYTDRLNARTPVNQVDPKYLNLGTLLQANINDPLVVARGFTKPFSSFTGTLAQSLRPYPQYLNIGQNYSAQGSSRYNGMMLKVERRYSAFNLLAGYVFSRAQMYRGADSSNCGCINPQDAYNYAVERSIHTNDIPHTLNLIWTLDMPFGKGRRYLGNSNALVRTAVSGWTISGAQQYRSGTLVRVTVPNALAGVLFNGELRPNATGQPFGTGVNRKDLDPNNPNIRWLNPAAFSIPAPFTFGNASAYYNQLRNPVVFVENLGIVKRTPITERVNFEVRADISNLFNRTSFGNIFGDISVPANFGRASGPMQGPRVIQIAGRFNF